MEKHGFRFRDDLTHADVAFDAWGETLEELFTEGAQAFLSTTVEHPETISRRQKIRFRLRARNAEHLLQDFLEELVFLKDTRRLLLQPEAIHIIEDDQELVLSAEFAGEGIDPTRHKLASDIKAATYHRFKLEHSDSGWKATVVLDV